MKVKLSGYTHIQKQKCSVQTWLKLILQEHTHTIFKRLNKLIYNEIINVLCCLTSLSIIY